MPTCVIHLLHNSFRYTPRQHWEQIAKDLKPIYTAVSRNSLPFKLLLFVIVDGWSLIVTTSLGSYR